MINPADLQLIDLGKGIFYEKVFCCCCFSGNGFGRLCVLCFMVQTGRPVLYRVINIKLSIRSAHNRIECTAPLKRNTRKCQGNRHHVHSIREITLAGGTIE
jgi:hypothetical protein